MHRRRATRSMNGGAQNPMPYVTNAMNGKPMADATQRLAAKNHRERDRILRRQVLAPRERRIHADAERDPLRRVADQRSMSPTTSAVTTTAAPTFVEQRAPTDARSRDQRQRRQHRKQFATRDTKRVRFDALGQTLALTAARFAQRRHPQRHQQPRQTDGKKRRVPRLQSERRGRRIGKRVAPTIDDHAAEEDPDAGADVDAARIDRDRGRAQPRRKMSRTTSRTPPAMHSPRRCRRRSGTPRACRSCARFPTAPSSDSRTRDRPRSDSCAPRRRRVCRAECRTPRRTPRTRCRTESRSRASLTPRSALMSSARIDRIWRSMKLNT